MTDLNKARLHHSWVPGSLIRRLSQDGAIIPHSGIVDRPYSDGRMAIVHNCKNVGVIRTAITDFAEPGQHLEILHPVSGDHQQAVLARAYDALSRGVGYAAAVQNCQDFANWAYYGIQFSETRNGVLTTVIIAGAFGALMALSQPPPAPSKPKVKKKKTSARKPRKRAPTTRTWRRG